MGLLTGGYGILISTETGTGSLQSSGRTLQGGRSCYLFGHGLEWRILVADSRIGKIDARLVKILERSMDQQFAPYGLAGC